MPRNNKAITEHLAELELLNSQPIKLDPSDPNLHRCKDCGKITWYGSGKHGLTSYETRPIGFGRYHCTRKTKHFPNHCNVTNFVRRHAEMDKGERK